MSEAMIIYEKDILYKYDYIDILKIKEEYRLHNILSGIILKVDKIAAFLVSLLEEKISYEALKARFLQLLGEKYLFVYDDGKIDKRVCEYTFHYLFKDELELLFRIVDLKIVDCYGNFDKTPYNRNSNIIIYCLR